MTKMKKFLALLASLTAVATLGLATACGDKGDSSTPVDTPSASTPGDSTPDDSTPVEKQYTVTVKKPDGTPAAGYWLQTCVGDNCSTPAQTDANGVFTFTFEEDATVYHVQATNGGGDDYADYEAVDFNTVPGTLTYEVQLTLAADGSVERPYVIEAGKTYTASKDAQNYVYFTITSDVSGTYTFNLPETNEGNPTIEISGVEEVVDGVTFGVIAGIKVVIGIVNSGWNEDYTEELYYDTTFSVDFEAGEVTPDGSKLAPFTVENGQSYTVPGSTWSGVWYTFTAPSAGQYKLTLDDWNTTNAEFSFRDTAWATLYRGYATDIAKGETILFGAYNYLDAESSWTFSFGEALENDVNYDVPPVLGDEDLPLEITEAGDYEITVAAGATYYVNLAFLGQFVIPEGLTAGAWISYPMTQYAAGDTVAHTEYHPNMNAYLAVEIYNNGEEAVTATLTAVDYTPPAPIAEGKIDVTTTDNNGWFDLYTFTAEVEGEYVFALPEGLGLYTKAAYDSWSQPESDFMWGGGGIVKVLLAEGATYEFYVGAETKTDWEITYQVFEAEVEEGGNEGGEETLNVLTVGSNTVVLSDDNYNVGVDYTFTPDVAGLYTFASGDVMFQVLHPTGLQMGSHRDPQIALEEDITYTVKVAGFAAGTYSLSITAPSVSESGDQGSEGGESGNVIEDIFAAPIVTEANVSTQIIYTFTLTEAATVTFTFDNADTWFFVATPDGTTSYSGYQQLSYTYELPAGTYEMGIGTWEAASLTLTLTVTK